MKIAMSDIARGRRIVAMAARDLSLTRKSPRPRRAGVLRRLLRAILR
ncbi:hypothetical protein [Citreimonas sp.]